MKRSRNWPTFQPRLMAHIGISFFLSIGANPKYAIGKISCALLVVATVCFWITLRNIVLPMSRTIEFTTLEQSKKA